MRRSRLSVFVVAVAVACALAIGWMVGRDDLRRTELRQLEAIVADLRLKASVDSVSHTVRGHRQRRERATTTAATTLRATTELPHTPVPCPTLPVIAACASGVQERSFYDIAKQCGTDKVTAHHYETAYQRYLGPLSLPDVPEFTLLEIGFAAGGSACVWREMLPRAESHSFEIGCFGPNRAKNEWIVNAPLFSTMVAEGKLHCGDGSSADFARPIISTFRHPLMVVIDDGGHGPSEMAGSFTYLFPRIQARGIFIMEDLAESYYVGESGFIPRFVLPLVQNLQHSNEFGVTAFLATQFNATAGLARFLSSMHCYQHLCVFLRNDVPPLPP
jgi:hypothetical protein